MGEDGEMKAMKRKDIQVISRFREEFVRRLTVDSEHSDRRKKDYNQAIFDAKGGWAVFNGTNLDMVMQAFDTAVKDYMN